MDAQKFSKYLSLSLLTLALAACGKGFSASGDPAGVSTESSPSAPAPVPAPAPAPGPSPGPSPSPSPVASLSQYCLSDASVTYAQSAEQIWFDPTLSGGAHTWVFNNTEAMKAIDSFCGDTRLDAALLSQIRYILPGNMGPTATGGYQDQKQLGAAVMFLLAKNNARIWNQLTAAEQNIINIDMEALLYSTVLTTKDVVFANIGVGMDGDTNENRDWNPNHQNGMVGVMIATTLYFGADQVEAMLAAYSDTAFIATLQQYNMTNLLWTYTNSARPAGSVIQAGLRQIVNGNIYSFHGITERNILGLFGYIADRTFSMTLDCGLNNGAGFDGSGKIVQNCGLLPNVGVQGMIFEFNTVDGGGPRSDGFYVWDSWYPMLDVRAALQMLGILGNTSISSTTIAITESDGQRTLTDIMSRYFIGTNDMFFKISPASNEGGGYLSYSNGENEGPMVLDAATVQADGSNDDLDLFNILQKALSEPTVQ